MIPEPILRKKIIEFLEEDSPFYDLTSELVENREIEAEIWCMEQCLLCGVHEAKTVFEVLGCKTRNLKEDGHFANNEPVISIKGYSRPILLGERLALNMLGRMSGIATLTKKAVDIAKKVNPNIKIACTRKTTPGFRLFEKKAVLTGGGDPHRLSLSDMILIKDNHIPILRDDYKNKISFSKRVEVEVKNLEEALRFKDADIIMLDNMSIKDIEHVIKNFESQGIREKVLFEASGNIDLDNLEEYAKTGVDIISMGLLTHSARAIDFSLRIKKV
ncbi:MAG: carboxylating nicotinate-nucleotide diphosphorylase [Candidatus Hydrothermarchaeota archaeon]